MSKGKPRDLVKESQWRSLLARHDRSGLSVRAFCELHGLSEASLYAWRRTLQERDSAKVQFVPVHVTPEPKPTTTDGSTGAIELVLGASRRLRIGPGFDGPTLTRLLALLEEDRP
jgi:hypothetical protein